MTTATKQYLGLTALLCIPLLFSTYQPLVDYPSHLARDYILAHYNYEPFFQQHYRVTVQPIPNLAMDLVIPLLAQHISILWAGKLFLFLTFLVYALGCELLARHLYGKDTRAAFIPLFLFYNSTFLMGFVNYTMGVSLFLLQVALWFRWRDHWTVTRIVVFCLLMQLCFLAHLSSIALVDITIFTLWLRYRNHLGILLMANVTPLICYLVFMHGTGSVGKIVWNSPTGKVIALLDVIRSYDVTADILFLVSICAVAVYFWVDRHNVALNKQLLLPATVLLGCFLICPLALYTSFGADARFVWPACILFVMCLRLRWTNSYRALYAMIMILLLTRMSIIVRTWYQLDQETAAIVQSFSKLPEHVAIYPMVNTVGGIDEVKRERGLEHAICYATITRHDYVPTVFAQKGQQPLVQTGPSYKSWSNPQWSAVGYQYVWAYQPSRDQLRWLRPHATLLSVTGKSSLWVLHQSGKFTVWF